MGPTPSLVQVRRRMGNSLGRDRAPTRMHPPMLSPGWALAVMYGVTVKQRRRTLKDSANTDFPSLVQRSPYMVRAMRTPTQVAARGLPSPARRSLGHRRLAAATCRYDGTRLRLPPERSAEPTCGKLKDGRSAPIPCRNHGPARALMDNRVERLVSRRNTRQGTHKTCALLYNKSLWSLSAQLEQCQAH